MPASIFNTHAGRCLLEGEDVRIVEGQSKGLCGLIVGFDLLNEAAPVVVGTKQGIRQIAANEADVFSLPPRYELEPLTMTTSRLAEEWTGDVVTCGPIAIMPMKEGGAAALVPKAPIPLSAVIRRHGGGARGLVEALKQSFVTRLPHLITGFRSRLDAVLERRMATADVVGMLLS